MRVLLMGGPLDGRIEHLREPPIIHVAQEMLEPEGWTGEPVQPNKPTPEMRHRPHRYRRLPVDLPEEASGWASYVYELASAR
jgi:hypothetical protein